LFETIVSFKHPLSFVQKKQRKTNSTLILFFRFSFAKRSGHVAIIEFSSKNSLTLLYFGLQKYKKLSV
jgi:hypothetical protein